MLSRLAGRFRDHRQTFGEMGPARDERVGHVDEGQVFPSRQEIGVSAREFLESVFLLGGQHHEMGWPGRRRATRQLLHWPAPAPLPARHERWCR